VIYHIITICISDWRQFSDIHISQGSVATRLRCGGIFEYEFVADLPLSPSAKELWKSVIIWGSYGQEFSVLFFYILTVYNINTGAMFSAAVAASIACFVFETPFSLSQERQSLHWPAPAMFRSIPYQLTTRAFQFAIRIDSIRFVMRIDSNRFVL